MIPTIMVVGGLAVVAAWALVRIGRASVWTAMSVATGGAAAAALVTGRVALSSNVTPVWAVPLGAASGLALYGATVGFVTTVRRWPAFRRHVEEVYDLRRGLSHWTALLLAAGVVSSAEEIFWRGLFQERLSGSLGHTTAAVLTWLAYVAANLPSASLPILAGAMVSGAAWGALALWTGGVLASVVCHSVWTGLMVAFPPGSRRRGPSRTRARTAS